MRRREFLVNCGLASLASPLLMKSNVIAKELPGLRANYFPNLILRTHENKVVRFYDDLVKGKLVTFNFMYAICDGICPGMTANLVKVQKLLGRRVGRDIFMYSITLQPEVDSPRVLSNYVKDYGIKPGWQFLTGKRADIEILRRKLGFVDPDPVIDKDKSQHIGLVRVGNERLDRWLACPALANPEQIVKSILWLEMPKG